MVYFMQPVDGGRPPVISVSEIDGTVTVNVYPCSPVGRAISDFTADYPRVGRGDRHGKRGGESMSIPHREFEDFASPEEWAAYCREVTLHSAIDGFEEAVADLALCESRNQSDKDMACWYERDGRDKARMRLLEAIAEQAQDGISEAR